MRGDQPGRANGFARAASAGIAAVLFMLVLPAAAQAWKVDVHVHGAGKVTETTDAELMDCTVSTAGRSNSSVTTCTAGSSAGGYGHGWIVELQASVPTEHFNRGWRFQRWVDGGTNRINCDPQGTTGNHTEVNCRFQIFQDLSIDLYFVDVAAPDTSITGGPNGTTGGGATFNFNSPDPDASYECKLDAGGWSVCGSPFDKAESYPGLSHGSHTFSVRAKDPTGNTDQTPATSTWFVDRAGPIVTISKAPKRILKTRKRKVRVKFEFGADESAEFTCQLDRAEPAPCTSPWRRKVKKGKHKFKVTATDAADNRSAPMTYRFTVKRKR